MTKRTHLLFILAFTACLAWAGGCDSGSGSSASDDTSQPADTNAEDTTSDGGDTNTSADDTNDDNQGTDPKDTGSDPDGDTGGDDTGKDTSKDTGKDTGTGKDTDTGEKDTGTGTGIDTDDIDTDVSIECDVPEGFLDKPINEDDQAPTSWITFQFEGILNERDDPDPQPGTGHVNAVFHGSSLDLNHEIVAFFSSPNVVIQAASEPDADGNLYYAEFRLALFDVMDMNDAGKRIIDVNIEGDMLTTAKLFSGKSDEQGNVTKLCLIAEAYQPYEPFYPTEYYVCNTEIDFMNNTGEQFPIAGRFGLFDDTDYITDTDGVACFCDNGVGGWRNCDEGIPDVYGLVRFGFKTGPLDSDRWTKYIYDDSKLWNSSGLLNKEYVLAHPEGRWLQGDGFVNGGLNLGPYVPSLAPEEEWLYGFGISVPAGSVTIGLAGHRSDIDKIVLYEQSFNTEGDDAEIVGFWVNTFVPNTLQTGDSLTFGHGEHEGQLFVYDYEDPNKCIIAAACGGEPVSVVRAENLDATEGGQLQLRSNPAHVNGHDTRYSVKLYHPSELPESCDWTTYLEEASQPAGVAVCPKW